MNNSKKVTSNQIGIHEELIEITSRYNKDNFQRPIAEHSLDNMNIIMQKARNYAERVVLDMGCGIGESTYKLSLKYPDSLVVGIDRSHDRLDRKNHFKKKLPENCLLLRGELQDIWYLLNQPAYKSLNIVKQYILYPNPYPKKKHIQKRWHGNPISSFIFNLRQAPIEIRSNWHIYIDEFCEVALSHGYEFSRSELNDMGEYMTPFEKKYLLSGQKVYCAELVSL